MKILATPLAAPGVGSSNLSEGLKKTEEIDDHNSKDIKTVTFKGTVLEPLVQMRNHQETVSGFLRKTKILAFSRSS